LKQKTSALSELVGLLAPNNFSILDQMRNRLLPLDRCRSRLPEWFLMGELPLRQVTVFIFPENPI
jgi:hypothetical protein